MSNTTTKWERSSFCGSAACVEVALGGDIVEIRDGKNPKMQTLRLTWPQWDALVNGIKAGQFDLP